MSVLNYRFVQIVFVENRIRLRNAQHTGNRDTLMECNCFLIIISALFKRRILQIKQKIYMFGNNDEYAPMVPKIITWVIAENCFVFNLKITIVLNDLKIKITV